MIGIKDQGSGSRIKDQDQEVDMKMAQYSRMVRIIIIVIIIIIFIAILCALPEMPAIVVEQGLGLVAEGGWGRPGSHRHHNHP